jgi:hypothetical protein
MKKTALIFLGILLLFTFVYADMSLLSLNPGNTCPVTCNLVSQTNNNIRTRNSSGNDDLIRLSEIGYIQQTVVIGPTVVSTSNFAPVYSKLFILGEN